MIKAVIFDLDNTLVDFMAMKRQAIEAAIQSMIDAGLALTTEDVRQRINAIYQERGIEFRMCSISCCTTSSAGRLQDPFGGHHRLPARPRSGAGPLSARQPDPHRPAEARVKLAVVSDAPAREAWLRLCSLNFHHLFDCVVTFGDTGERKPSPAPFRKALEGLRVEPARSADGGRLAGTGRGRRASRHHDGFARYGDTFGTQDAHADYELADISALLPIVDGNSNRGEQAMIRGIGVDIIEIARIRASIQSTGGHFLAKVFTDGEIAYCSARPNADQHYAARFAAKEAVSKALATGWAGVFRWKDVEVTNAPSGQPLADAARRPAGVARRSASAVFSLSHSDSHVVAVAVIEDTGT